LQIREAAVFIIIGGNNGLYFNFERDQVATKEKEKMFGKTLNYIGNGIGMIRNRLKINFIRGGSGHGESRWGPGTQERPNRYVLNGTPLPPGQKRKWEDWELPYYITGVLNVVILVVGLTAKPDTTIETWAHKKTVECIEQKEKQQRILDIAGM
jgi:hypothetical protein